MPTITPQIVNLTAVVSVAPEPSQLQQSGAFLSFGGTVLAANDYQYCADLATVQSLLSSSGNYAELNKMATTFFAQGSAVGVSLLEFGVISDIDDQITALQDWLADNPGVFYGFLCPSNWDSSEDQVGSVTITEAGSGYTSAPSVTFAAPGGGGTTALGTATIQNGTVIGISISNPGSGYASAPAVTIAAPSGTTATATAAITGDAVSATTITNGGAGYTAIPSVTFSAPSEGDTATGVAVVTNGVVTAINITDPGSGYESAPTITIAAPTGVTATGTANLASGLSNLASDYDSATGKTYFLVTAATSNLDDYADQKSIITVVPSPLAPSTEFTAASAFYDLLMNNPNAANRLAPFGYRYVYGVTAWPTKQNQATLTNILSAYGNYIGTGAEGGISNTLLRNGTTMDGSQINWWYGVDWFQIQVKQALAAAIINGSNSNPPLYYDQNGINTLQKIAQNIANDGVAFGCLLSATISATPFATYVAQNPDDYQAGIYNGLTAQIVGQNGFLTITFAIDALQFVPTT
jgi:hypothetical protein